MKQIKDSMQLYEFCAHGSLRGRPIAGAYTAGGAAWKGRSLAGQAYFYTATNEMTSQAVT